MSSRQAQRLRAEHAPRNLKVANHLEPRLSRADERTISDAARVKDKRRALEALSTDFAALAAGLQAARRIVERYAQEIPGDHRDDVRALAHHVRRAQSVVDRLRGRIS